MLSIFIFRTRQVMVTIGFIMTILGNASASPNTLTVQDPRPVAKAIQELEKRYGWRITYEDPPYSHYGDITDVRDTDWPGVPVQSSSRLQSLLQANKSTLVPKGGSLTFTLPSAHPDELGAVEALLKSYNESHRGFEFAVMHDAGLLHVVPKKARGLSGNLEPVKPVLDTVITIEPKERSAYALMKEICNKIFAGTKTRVGMGYFPVNMFFNMKTSIGGSGKPARSILEQLILETRAPLSWRLLYDPDDKEYALNIKGVAPISKQ